MMQLTFPTMAEQVVAAFRNATKTVSIVTLAKQQGAHVTKANGVTEYRFDDDTTITVRGKGCSHQVESHLP